MVEGQEDARSDAELLGAAREDPDSFRVLYDRYAKRVHQFFERRTRDREISLDLTSETFARAWLARTKFRDLADGSAGPWLFAIARSVLVRSVEKLRLETDARRRLGLLVERPLLEPEPNERWLDGLDQALEALPERQRDAVRLRVIEGLSYGELARALDCSATAARIRVSRGLSTLRTTIEGDWL